MTHSSTTPRPATHSATKANQDSTAKKGSMALSGVQGSADLWRSLLVVLEGQVQEVPISRLRRVSKGRACMKGGTRRTVSPDSRQLIHSVLALPPVASDSSPLPSIGPSDEDHPFVRVSEPQEEGAEM